MHQGRFGQGFRFIIILWYSFPSNTYYWCIIIRFIAEEVSCCCVYYNGLTRFPDNPVTLWPFCQPELNMTKWTLSLCGLTHYSLAAFNWNYVADKSGMRHVYGYEWDLCVLSVKSHHTESSISFLIFRQCLKAVLSILTSILLFGEGNDLRLQ